MDTMDTAAQNAPVQKSSKGWIVGIVIIAILIIAGVGYYMASRQQPSQALPPLSSSDKVSAIANDLQNTSAPSIDLSGLGN